jgi:NADPH:quinone reductase-like Zn-dependent oxidoreductase
MKAIVQAKYGSPDDLELRDVDMPVVSDEDVLVRVRAASVHPDVWHVVSGRPYVLRLMGAGFSRPRNPIPGTDMAGIVESVGKRATRFRPGDPVFGETSGLIALQNLRGLSQRRPEQKVLINGAGGGVGTLALQITRARGAHVTAVDCTGKLGLLRSLGADEVVDYTREDFTRRGVRYDLIFDVPGNQPFSACRRALEPEGRYVLIRHERFGASGKRVFGLIPQFLGLMFLSRFVKQLRGPGLPMPTKKEAMVVLRELLEGGKITPVIDRSFPLSEVRGAFRHLIEDEIQGKVILAPSDTV